jgi:hypothetical protein
MHVDSRYSGHEPRDESKVNTATHTILVDSLSRDASVIDVPAYQAKSATGCVQCQGAVTNPYAARTDANIFRLLWLRISLRLLWTPIPPFLLRYCRCRRYLCHSCYRYVGGLLLQLVPLLLPMSLLSYCLSKAQARRKSTRILSKTCACPADHGTIDGMTRVVSNLGCKGTVSVLLL